MHGFIGLTLLCLSIFQQNSATATQEELHCQKPPEEVEAGQNIIIHCKITSRSSSSNCDIDQYVCEHPDEKYKCELNTSAMEENNSRNGTVEIFNVTRNGTYKIRVMFKCGTQLNYSFEVKIVTTILPTKSPLSDAPTNSGTKAAIIVGGVVLVLGFVVIILFLITRYRRRK